MRIGRSEGPRAPLDQLDQNGCTPLMYAVMGDSKDAIEVLMNFSAKKEVVSGWSLGIAIAMFELSVSISMLGFNYPHPKLTTNCNVA